MPIPSALLPEVVLNFFLDIEPTMTSKVLVADVLQQLRLAGYDGPVAAYEHGRVQQYMLLAGGYDSEDDSEDSDDGDDGDDGGDEYGKYQRPPAELEGNTAAVEEWVVREFAQDKLIAPRRKQLEVGAHCVRIETLLCHDDICSQ